LAFRILDSEWYDMDATYFVFPKVLENTKKRLTDLLETKFENIDNILEYNKFGKV
jgi:hypothetical protein